MLIIASTYFGLSCWEEMRPKYFGAIINKLKHSGQFVVKLYIQKVEFSMTPTELTATYPRNVSSV